MQPSIQPVVDRSVQFAPAPISWPTESSGVQPVNAPCPEPSIGSMSNTVQAPIIQAPPTCPMFVCGSDGRPYTPNHCTGRSQSLSTQTNWFGFRSKPITQDTRCQYCAVHLKALGEQGLYYLSFPSSQIFCDSITDDSISSMIFNNFRFKVVSPDEKVPFVVNPDKSELRNKGVFVVEMPDEKDYAVLIEPNVKPTHMSSFGCVSSTHNHYFTYEMYVGDRKVSINNGEVLYYNKQTKVLGFQTGTSESFRFVAEKSRAAHAGAAGINAPNTNIITIKVNRFRREAAPTVSHVATRNESDWWHSGITNKLKAFRGNSDGITRVGHRENSSRYFGSGVLMGRHSTSAEPAGARQDQFDKPEQDIILDSMYEECQDLGGGFDSPRPQFGSSAAGASAAGMITNTTGMAIPTAMSSSAPRVTGGSTISGQRYVTNINTQTTNDRFVPLDSFSVTIQLIHVEGKRYQAKLMNNHTNELLPNVDYLTEQRRRQQEEQLAAQRALLVPTVPQSTVLPNTLSNTQPNTQPPANWNYTSTGFSLFD